MMRDILTSRFTNKRKGVYIMTSWLLLSVKRSGHQHVALSCHQHGPLSNTILCKNCCKFDNIPSNSWEFPGIVLGSSWSFASLDLVQIWTVRIRRPFASGPF
eukprot:1194466-Prorocentrum_minimum.AAC.1